ncbi:MAG: phosphate uptake regulator PhoU [Patescibacteria group bacterium]|nr:phosphate uptake regulator PhoU [Patescibacteria group bacterium]
MEVRKLQKTGGASLTVTLPKKWVKDLALEDKSLVNITVDNQNCLIIQPSPIKKSLLRSSLSLDGLSAATLTQKLIAHYISGVDEIVIYCKKILPEQRTQVRELCSELIGFELLDESSEKIVLKNVFDPSKFSMSQNVEKMFLITKSMLEDAYKALAQQDLVLASDVINRDSEVDKFQIAITRQLYTCIRKDIVMEEMGLTEIDLFFYQNIATQVERIADHTVKIAKTVATSEIVGTPIRTSSVITGYLAQLLLESHEMIETLNSNKAHEILEISQEIENQIYSKKTRKHTVTFAWEVLEDSLDRIRGYIMNMAEITIDQAVLKIK